MNGGATCEDQDYLDWLMSLQRQGFEIALHNATPCTSSRKATLLALGRFHELFGSRDILFCNHTSCRENIYWDDARLSSWRRAVYNPASRGKRRNISKGHIPGDPLFWGDLCREHVRFGSIGLPATWSRDPGPDHLAGEPAPVGDEMANRKTPQGNHVRRYLLHNLGLSKRHYERSPVGYSIKSAE